LAKGQLDNANQQLKLAKDQFKTSNDQRKADLRIMAKRDSEQKVKEYNDSNRNAFNDNQQKKNNDYQNSINKQQLLINKQQLVAIQIQAKVADDQFKFQKIQSSNQFQDNRPIFMVDSVKYDKSKDPYMPTISFHVTNHGIRNPHVDSTVIAIWNFNNKCSRVEKHITNIDLRDVSFITGIGIYQDCIDDPNTIYFLNIIYEDTNDGQIKSKPIFFRYKIKPDKSLVTFVVADIETIEFVKYLKLQEKGWGRLL